MDWKKYTEERTRRLEFERLSGFHEADPRKNGEFRLLSALSKRVDGLIDVGAHKGEYLEELRRITQTIPYVGFEAHPESCAELKRRFSSVAAHRFVCQALSDESTKRSFFSHPVHSDVNSLSERALMTKSFREEMMAIQVQTRRLDEYEKDLNAFQRPFIKVDVEGSEGRVIRGAKEYLSSRSAVLLFEYSFAWVESGQGMKEVLDDLFSMGFCVFRLTPFGLEQLRFYQPQLDDSRYCNYVAMRPEDWGGLFCSKETLDSALGSVVFWVF